MGGRDHSIECEHCGARYGGFNGPEECPCREIVSGGGLPTAIPRIDPFLTADDQLALAKSACNANADTIARLTTENTSLRQQVEELRKERDEAAENLAQWCRMFGSGWQDDTPEAQLAELNEQLHAITSDRDSLRAQLERVMPVYEAAVEWSESFGELSKRLPPHVHKLRDAVDAALTSATKEGGR